MSDVDTRVLCGRISLAKSRVHKRLSELEVQLQALWDDPPSDALHREREINCEATALLERSATLDERYKMLIAFAYQKRHGFPILAEVDQ